MSILLDDTLQRRMRARARLYCRSEDPATLVAAGMIAVLQAERKRPLERPQAWNYARAAIRSTARHADLDRRHIRDYLELRGPRRDPPVEVMDVPAYLNVLTPGQRRCVELHLWDGLDSEQVGLRLGIVPGAARKLYGRALAKIRRRYPDG